MRLPETSNTEEYEPMKTSTPLLLALLVLAVAAPNVARAQSPQNPILISSAPYTITQSGYYRLSTNLNFDPGNNNAVNIITVNASNVTIDFNGFYIAGPVGNTAQQVTGIFANERSNVTITNGTIAYCFRGVQLTGNGSTTTNNVGHRIEKMRVTYCYRIGLEVDNAPATLITQNQISQIGGTSASTSFTLGIYVFGSGGTVADNVITKVSNSVGGTSNYGISTGSASFVVRNTIANTNIGVECLGKYQANLTFGCTTPFAAGGTDAGLNN